MAIAYVNLRVLGNKRLLLISYLVLAVYGFVVGRTLFHGGRLSNGGVFAIVAVTPFVGYLIWRFYKSEAAAASAAGAIKEAIPCVMQSSSSAFVLLIKGIKAAFALPATISALHAASGAPGFASGYATGEVAGLVIGMLAVLAGGAILFVNGFADRRGRNNEASAA